MRWTRAVFGVASGRLDADGNLGPYRVHGFRIGSGAFRGLSFLILGIAWYLAVIFDIPIWNVIVQTCS